jgi:hypothetical protein
MISGIVKKPPDGYKSEFRRLRRRNKMMFGGLFLIFSKKNQKKGAKTKYFFV